MNGTLTLRAPAKLNLTLEVLARRSDGLHGLRSVMIPIDLCDELHISNGGSIDAFTCSIPELQENNLVQRAVAALGIPPERFAIALDKHIPTGAGMGGGSSDAAAVLLAAQRGSLGAIDTIDYVALARSLGSDVPFFLVETAALVEGTGERVTALGAVPPWHAVVIKPPVAVSTAWAYAEIDSHPQPTRARGESVSLRMVEALQSGAFESVVSLLQNDFHDVLCARTPEIARALDLLHAGGATHALMTGSGSCVFTLVRNASERDALSKSIDLPDGFTLYTGAFWNGAAWRSAA